MSSKESRGIQPNIRTYKLKSNVSGMAQNRAETFLRPDQAIDIVNMHATEEGSWSANDIGYTVLNGTAFESGAVINGIATFTDTAGDDHLFIAINSKLKEVDTSLGTDSTIDGSAGYGLTSQVDFEVMNDILYTADGTIATPRTWDGVSAGDAAGWPVNDGVNNYDTPKLLEAFQGRMVFATESHLIISDFEDAESFTFPAVSSTDACIVGVSKRDGQFITGLKTIHVPAMLTNEEQLIVFTNKSTYLLAGSSSLTNDADAFRLIKINGTYGAVNNRSVVQVGNDVLVLNEFGVTSYSSSSQGGTIQPNPINSDLVKDVIGDLNRVYKHLCWGVHLPHRREVMFFMPVGASTQCNAAIVFKYPSPGTTEIPKWSRRTDASGKFKLSHGCLLNRVFYISTYSGKVGTMFTSSKYDDIGIPWLYEYPYWDAGNEKQNKRVLNSDAHFKVRSNQTVSMATQWKGGGNNDKLVQTLEVETTVAGAIFGTAVYGTDYYGEQEEVKVQYEVPGDGLRLKHTLSGTTDTSGPEFLGLTPVVSQGNISQHWY